MARAAGIEGFVFYFYWFNGTRLLDGPLEALLADRSIELPFCLLWANENWTRRWDGSDDDVLISQDFRHRGRSSADRLLSAVISPTLAISASADGRC